MVIVFDPSRLWYLSTRLHRAGWHVLARAIKLYNFIIFRAILPPEAELASPVKLGHYAMNIVIHPNTTIGNGVMIWHNVTLSVSDSPGSSSRLTVGDDVTLGTGAVIVTPLRSGIVICDAVTIGANSVVTRSISERGTYAGAPAVLVSPLKGRKQ